MFNGSTDDKIKKRSYVATEIRKFLLNKNSSSNILGQLDSSKKPAVSSTIPRTRD